nr:MAG TPA: hypothetical protein [Caudoviricetes sp.]
MEVFYFESFKFRSPKLFNTIFKNFRRRNDLLMISIINTLYYNFVQNT